MCHVNKTVLFEVFGQFYESLTEELAFYRAMEDALSCFPKDKIPETIEMHKYIVEEVTKIKADVKEHLKKKQQLEEQND